MMGSGTATAEEFFDVAVRVSWEDVLFLRNTGRTYFSLRRSWSPLSVVECLRCLFLPTTVRWLASRRRGLGC